jgi:hypothetical protein
MGSIPFALSVHNFISSVGADAGFASIIGLAIVILLYFAHARETSALREQAADLAARLQEAEAKLLQATRTGAAVAPVPAPPLGGIRVMAAAPTTAAAVSPPYAPAGTAAPALAAATRFVAAPAAQPVPAVAAPPAHPAPAPLTAVATATAAAPTASAPAAPAPAPAPALAPEAAPAPALQPAAAASQATAIPAPQTAAAKTAGAPNGSGEPVAAAPAPASAPRQILPRPAARHHDELLQRYPLLSEPPRRESSPRRIAAVLIGALVLAGAVVALIVATSSSGTPARSTAGLTTNAPAPTTRHAPAFNPATVTVAVLNGTATNHLAHRMAQRLMAKGYRTGKVATASDQTHISTIVAYLPGYRADALHVAAALGLGRASVQPIDSSTQQVVCPGNGACPANVVVTVGADLANS